MDDLLDKEVGYTWTAALGELERRPQVDNIGGISVSIVVVGVLMPIARYLKARETQLIKVSAKAIAVDGVTIHSFGICGKLA